MSLHINKDGTYKAGEINETYSAQDERNHRQLGYSPQINRSYTKKRRKENEGRKQERKRNIFFHSSLHLLLLLLAFIRHQVSSCQLCINDAQLFRLFANVATVSVSAVLRSHDRITATTAKQLIPMESVVKHATRLISLPLSLSLSSTDVTYRLNSIKSGMIRSRGCARRVRAQ